MGINKRIAVLGDVHGCFHTLSNLYSEIKNLCSEIYSVGDLIDRGKYSYEVVQFCIENNIKPVRGNHEDMLLNAIELFNPDTYWKCPELDIYIINGGDFTLLSYIKSNDVSEFSKFKKRIEKTGHLDFLKSFPLKIELDKILICHAGILDDGDDETILWNRYVPDNIGKLQIIGHTPQAEVNYDRVNNYINIDTGCVYGRRLTAVILDVINGELTEVFSEEINVKDKL